MGKWRSSILRYAAVLAVTALPLTSTGDDGRLVLLIQPLPREEQAAGAHQPLADYLETVTGRRCTIEIPPTFPAYWEAVRRNHYDLALDAPHFTDYRTQKLGFSVLARTPDVVSYSLIARAADHVRDPAQLVGKRIASLGQLSIGTLRLNALFPHAMRQPVLVDAASAEESVKWLLDKEVEAAFLPTPIVSRRLPQGGIAVVLTTEPTPHLGLSASPRLAHGLREKIRESLLQAHRTDPGRAMLRAIGLERFEAASAEDFANQSNVLKGYWGY